MARRLLKGDALTAFNNASTAHASESRNSFNAVIKSLTAHVFPMKALQQQKRYMRRFLRKPFDMKVQEFVSRMGELNEYLTSLPSATPGIAATKLPEDEVLDILEFSMPQSWQRQMLLLDFNPIDATTQEFVHFCQRLEMGETDEKKTESKTGNRDRKKKGKRKAESSAEHNEGLDCMLHGKNCGHTTKNCWTLKKQAAAAQKKGKHTSHSKKEINVMMKQAVVEAFNAASSAKKAKKAKKDKTEELQAFTKLTVLSDGEIAEAIEESDDGESSDSE